MSDDASTNARTEALRSSDVPVLLLAFNRPEATAEVLRAIQAYGPSRLFVAVDGPRPDRPDDVAAVRRVVELLDGIDIPGGEITTLIRSENLGCRSAIGTGIDWFFDHVEEGIILEDDCVPTPDFFRFCSELLDVHRTNHLVGMISGTNVLGQWRSSDAEASYHFGFGAIWGWATWKDRWGRSAEHLAGVEDATTRRAAQQTLGTQRWKAVAVHVDAVRRGSLDTWDFPWIFHWARKGQLAAIPATNLVTNIGFGAGATHTTTAGGPLDRLPTFALEESIEHPQRVTMDRAFDRKWMRSERGNLRLFLGRQLRRLTPRGPSGRSSCPGSGPNASLPGRRLPDRRRPCARP